MRLLATGVILLVSAFLCQLIIWRIALPRRQTIGLLAVFGSVPIVATGLWLVLHPAARPAPAEAMRVALFYVSFALAYIVCYSAIENESPTLSIVSYVAAAGTAGRADGELVERLGGGHTIDDRFAAMERSGWIVRDGDSVRLSAEGRSYGLLFESAAAFFGIAKGG